MPSFTSRRIVQPAGCAVVVLATWAHAPAAMAHDPRIETLLALPFEQLVRVEFGCGEPARSKQPAPSASRASARSDGGRHARP